MVKKLLKSFVFILPAKQREYILFYYFHRSWPSLKEPKKFNELISKRKIETHEDFYTYLSDKVKVKKFIEENVGRRYVIPTLSVFEELEKDDLLSIEVPYVIKCNHDSGSVKIIKSHSQVDDKLVEFFKNRLKKRHSRYNEYWYKKIYPLIVIEPFIDGGEGKAPHDYKFHVFKKSGLLILQVDYDRHGNHTRTFYDMKGKVLPFSLKYSNDFKRLPDDFNLESAFALADKIAKKINTDYVRVDLYNCDGRILFGELTFAHGGGFERFFPEEYDEVLGNYWRGVSAQ